MVRGSHSRQGEVQKGGGTGKGSTPGRHSRRMEGGTLGLKTQRLRELGRKALNIIFLLITGKFSQGVIHAHESTRSAYSGGKVNRGKIIPEEG